MSTDASGAADAPVTGSPVSTPNEQGLFPVGAAPEANAVPAAGAENTYESQAREKGWRPKEEYEGDPENWVDATEFVKRQPLFDKIKGQSKKLKELEKTVEALARHTQSSIEAAKAKAIADLKAERREAIELGEVARVEEIDEQINQTAQIEVPATPNKPVLAPEIEAFCEEQKSWFNVDPEMTAFAASFSETYMKTHRDATLEKALDETLKKVKLVYPDKFTNPRRETSSSVDTGGGHVEGSGKYSTNRLNPEQKIVYNQLVKVHKTMTHEAYFKSLDEAGFLEK